MSARYVQHDGYRWRVVADIMIDEQPGFELVRRVPVVKALGNGITERTVKQLRVVSRATI